jgi:hypothetical protein
LASDDLNFGRPSLAPKKGCKIPELLIIVFVHIHVIFVPVVAEWPRGESSDCSFFIAEARRTATV